MLAGSSTHTAVAWPSWRKAVVGSLMTGTPCAPASGSVIYTVAPSGGGNWAASTDTLTA